MYSLCTNVGLPVLLADTCRHAQYPTSHIIHVNIRTAQKGRYGVPAVDVQHGRSGRGYLRISKLACACARACPVLPPNHGSSTLVAHGVAGAASLTVWQLRTCAIGEVTLGRVAGHGRITMTALPVYPCGVDASTHLGGVRVPEWGLFRRNEYAMVETRLGFGRAELIAVVIVRSCGRSEGHHAASGKHARHMGR